MVACMRMGFSMLRGVGSIIANRTIKRINMTVGDVTISTIFDDHIQFKKDAYIQFSTNNEPDITTQLRYINTIPPKYEFDKNIFDFLGKFSISTDCKNYIMRFYSPNHDICGITTMAQNFRNAEIDIYTTNLEYIRKITLSSHLFQLLNFMSSLRQGIVVHACGICDNGKGYLFVGKSGAGKSTIAKLWSNKKDVCVLSDDQIIIKKIDNRFWIYGTPWFSSANKFSSMGVPLEKIFFIKHADENMIVRKKKSDAILVLMTDFRYFLLNFWDDSIAKYCLNFFSELIQNIPSYELGFVPNENVIGFIQNTEIFGKKIDGTVKGISHSEFIDIYKDILIKGYLRLPTYGKSMYPFIRDKDRVVIASVKPDNIKIGDIIAYNDRKYKCFFVHQVIMKKFKRNEMFLITKGISSVSFTRPVQEENLLGKIILIEKNNKTINLESKFWYVICYIIAMYSLSTGFIFKKLFKNPVLFVQKLKSKPTPNSHS